MNSNDLNLRLLRSFLTVAECGKVSAAAKQLHLSQPAVTAHVRRLEEIVGRPLISRSTRGVRLTMHGHTLRTLLAEIQNTLSRIETSFSTEQKLRIVDTGSAMITPELNEVRSVTPRLAVAENQSAKSYLTKTPNV